MAATSAIGAPRLSSPLRAGALTVLFMAVVISTPHAQVLSTTPQLSARPSAAAGAEAETSEVQLLVGRSAVLNTGTSITRLSLTSPDIADAMVTTTQQVLIHGKNPGTISMFVWDRSGGIKRYEVVVQRDLSQLTEQVRQLFPGEPIEVVSNGKDVVISGTVSSKYVIDKAADVAAGYVDKKDSVVNLLRQQEGVASNQIMLRVRFAEVSRSALTELGASFFTGATGYKDYIARSTTQQFSAPDFTEFTRSAMGDTVTQLTGKQTFSDFLNLFVFNTKYNVGALIKALQVKGLFQSLAEPNLIAQNGKEASFLAGGEYPYPVAQGSGSNQSITIVFKEFGIRLRFTPTMLGGDLVHLKVAPEVSSLDFTNAVVASGFRIPALSTRRADTEVELRDGQTFAIAGLMNNTLTSTMQKIPGIGDIPILGLLFRSKALQKAQTELVVMITPQIMKRDSFGVSPNLPNQAAPYMSPMKKTVPPPAPWQGPPPPSGNAAQAAPVQPSQSAPPPARPVVTSASQPTAPALSPARPGSVAPASGAKAPAPAPQPAGRPAVAPATQATAPVLAPAQHVVAPASQPAAPVLAPAPSRPAALEQPASPPAKLSKQQKQERERAAKEQKKQQELDAKRRAEEEKRAAEQEKKDQEMADQQRRQQELQAKQDDKEAAEQAKRDAEAAKVAEEAAKKQAEVDRKRGKALAEAEAKLKAAQAAYQAEIDRTKKDNSKPLPQR